MKSCLASARCARSQTTYHPYITLFDLDIQQRRLEMSLSKLFIWTKQFEQ